MSLYELRSKAARDMTKEVNARRVWRRRTLLPAISSSGIKESEEETVNRGSRKEGTRNLRRLAAKRQPHSSY